MPGLAAIPDLDQSTSKLSLEDYHSHENSAARPMGIPSVTAEDLGYEDAAPTVADQYGYGDGSPTLSYEHTYDRTRMPRRSSIKSGCGSHRRASIGPTTTTVVEVRMRGERFPVHRRRSIDFNASVLVKEVIPMTDVAPHEDLWLQPDEFEKMKSDRRAVVEKHKRGKAGEQDDIRGLEKYLDRSGKILKNRAWDAVLDEQEEQELAGVFNGDRIADLYRLSTSGTPDKAAEKAKQDHDEIRDYLISPRTTKLMMRRLSC
jgi:hypothetical protein